jgi:hypothetical protein
VTCALTVLALTVTVHGARTDVWHRCAGGNGQALGWGVSNVPNRQPTLLSRHNKAKWSLYVPHSGHCMYRQFNIQQFYVLPTQCIYVFCVDLRTNSDYFPIQH